MDIGTLVIAMAIPSAVTGFCFWILEIGRASCRERV